MDEHAISGSDDVDLGAHLRTAVGRVYRRFRTDRADGALGDTALTVLTYLHKHGPQTLTHLCETDRVSPASMSQTVNRLTSAGLAVRGSDPTDRRKVLFSTTPAGAALATEDISHRNAWLDAHLDALSAADRATITRAAELLNGIADS
jgi:DNA-binding MarR family transcriptional regulator